MSEEKTRIQQQLIPMVKEARAKGLWFYNKEKNVWLHPDDLVMEQAAGRFLWGAINWKLRDHRELVNQKIELIQKTQKEIELIISKTVKPNNLHIIN